MEYVLDFLKTFLEKYKIQFGNNQPARQIDKKCFKNGKDTKTVIFGPCIIKYKDTEDEIKNKVIEDTHNIKLFYPLNIGKYKLEDWNFEDEVRFKILSFNAMIGGKDKKDMTRKMEQINDYIYEEKFVLVDINPDAFNEEIEILLGPKTNESHKITVEALVNKFKKFIPKTKIEKSKKKVV